MEVRPGYKQTEVGVIPEEWEVKPIVQIATVGRGRVISHKEIARARTPLYPVYSSQTSDDGVMGYLDTFEFEGEYITWTTDGANAGTVFARDGRFNCTNVCGTIKLASDNHRFVAKVLGGIAPRHVSRHLGNPKLMNDVVKRISIPLPPTRAEQDAIAAALSNVDELISGLDRLIAKKRDLKQAAMQQLLTGKKRLPGFSGEWEVKRLGDVIAHCFSGATPRRNRPEFYKGDIRWITSGELNYNVITDTIEKISTEAVAETNLTIHPVGTFLMAITGLEAEGTRGACGIVGAPSTTNQSCMAVFPTAALAGEYLFHYYVFRGKFLALQYCQGTKQQSYTASLVKQLPIGLPPTLEEQTAIAEVLSDMDTELAALEQRREKTRALKQGMMQELLTGRTRLV